MNITRRIFLRTTAAAGIAGSAAGAAAAPTARDRIDFHLHELAKAMQEIDPAIERFWFDEEYCLAMVSKGLRRGTRIDGTGEDRG